MSDIGISDGVSMPTAVVRRESKSDFHVLRSSAYLAKLEKEAQETIHASRYQQFERIVLS